MPSLGRTGTVVPRVVCARGRGRRFWGGSVVSLSRFPVPGVSGSKRFRFQAFPVPSVSASKRVQQGCRVPSRRRRKTAGRGFEPAPGLLRFVSFRFVSFVKGRFGFLFRFQARSKVAGSRPEGDAGAPAQRQLPASRARPQVAGAGPARPGGTSRAVCSGRAVAALPCFHEVAIAPERKKVSQRRVGRLRGGFGGFCWVGPKSAPCGARTHDLRIMRLTRGQLR